MHGRVVGGGVSAAVVSATAVARARASLAVLIAAIGALVAACGGAEVDAGTLALRRAAEASVSAPRISWDGHAGGDPVVGRWIAPDRLAAQNSGIDAIHIGDRQYIKMPGEGQGWFARRVDPVTLRSDPTTRLLDDLRSVLDVRQEAPGRWVLDAESLDWVEATGEMVIVAVDGRITSITSTVVVAGVGGQADTKGEVRFSYPAEVEPIEPPAKFEML